MHEQKKQLDELSAEFEQAAEAVGLSSLQTKRDDLQQQSQVADFWQDSTKAQAHMRQLSELDARIAPWVELRAMLTDLRELIELDDETLAADISQQLQQANKQFKELKQQLQYSGPYDTGSALLSIHAGAGGTDAQDWAEMLLRMYIRWAEAHDYKVVSIEQSAGEEAGIKSATIEIDGQFVYGKLKGEHGVHRLVRLSPFNSDNLRQTSFAKVEVLPKIDTPEAVTIDDKDLKIDVYRSGGHGGQSVNTTDSAVRITHIPTGITVSIQNERSQLQNKETAMTILRSRLAQLQLEQHQDTISKLKGPNQSAEWGSQIRSYVLHPYKQVKDVRTKHESSDPAKVLDGDLDSFIQAYQEQSLGS